jgi:hypothetical protein
LAPAQTVQASAAILTWLAAFRGTSLVQPVIFTSAVPRANARNLLACTVELAIVTAEFACRTPQDDRLEATTFRTRATQVRCPASTPAPM